MEALITITGRVQGVGFRWYAKQKAMGLGLTGYAKNLYDGSVEVLAQGDKERIKELIEFLRSGPGHSHVENVTADFSEVAEDEKLNSFEAY